MCRIMQILRAALVAALPLSGTSAAATPVERMVHALAPADLEFVLRAAEEAQAEMKLAQLAQARAEWGAVKAFARRMVDEHSRANTELAAILLPRGTRPPRTISPIAQAVERTLAILWGEAFDRAYLAHQVATHEVSLARFRHAADDAETPMLRDFAQDHLVTIERHLEEVRLLKEEIESRT
jgi:putative membrane protein